MNNAPVTFLIIIMHYIPTRFMFKIVCRLNLFTLINNVYNVIYNIHTELTTSHNDCIKSPQTQCPLHTLCCPCTLPQYGPPTPQERRTPHQGASKSPALHHSPAPTGAAGQWSRHSRHTRSHQQGTRKAWSTLGTRCGRSTRCAVLWGDCCDVEWDCSSTPCRHGCQRG